MPITRSLRRQVVKGEFAPVEPVPVPAPVTAPASLEARPGPSSKRSASSKKSVQRAEAFEKLAKARLDEARAATALAEAELSRIEAEDTEGDDQDSVACDIEAEREGLVRNWLENKTMAPNEQTNTPIQRVPTEVKTQGVNQVIDVASLTAALTEAARAMHTPRYLVELPNFSGASGEWLAFRAAYRDTHSHFTKAENLARLRRSLKGLAREATMALFVAETDPDDVLSLLQMRFGRPDTLVISEMERLRALPRLTDNPRDICIFTSKVINIVGVVKALKRDYYLYNPETIRALVDKMTPAIRYRWYDFAAERPEDEADLLKLSAFLSREADLCSRYAQAEVVRDNSPPPHHQRKTHRTYLTAPSISAESQPTQKASTSLSSPQVCIVCDNRHAIQDCNQFKALIVTDRWEKAKEVNACFRCLKKRSFHHRCRYRACGIEECKGSHHPLLHTPRDSPAEPVTVASARQHICNKALLKIVPVTVRGPSGTVDTFALLDEGSTITLVEEETARAVGATGPIEPFAIEGVAGARVNANMSRHVNFYIGRRHSEKEHRLEARTIDRLHLSCQNVDQTTIEDCEHLSDIANELVYDCGTPTLLIGQDNWHMIVSKSIKSGVRGTPVASLTELGWVLHGPCRNSARVHFVTKLTVREEEEEVNERLDNLLRQFIDIESLGVEPKRPKNDPNVRALTLLDKHSHRLPDGRFETGLLWRSEELELPENKDYAMRRLIGIEKKLDKDPYLKQQYNAQITHLLESGFAEVAPSSSRSGRTWYLPHFAVVNPSKPKPRIVLDAAAKTCGVSLNDMLLTGPDLLQSLPGVLMRFRQRPIAVSGDIKEMFLQISIRTEDRDALRFLWRADEREGNPVEYRMKSVIFGAASSPCTAIYIKNRNAEEYRTKYPDAADAISRNHYMDDYLQSFDSKEDAIRIAKEVSHVHQQAKFHLQKWASNVPEVVAAIEPQQKTRSEEVLLQNNPLPALEKTLGLVWRTTADQLTFNLDLRRVNPEVVDGTKRPTKREFLRTIMSLFDPLGLVTPVSLPARGILQDTWRLGVQWDEFLPDELHRRWLEWLSHMKNLRSLFIPRCYPHCSTAKHLELHVFVDASEKSFVATVYWRATISDSAIRVSLIMAKGRVAPLKLTSIPRLELQAAVLGCRLARTVETEHDFKPARRIFWTDSRNVLAWLRSGPRTFKPFVAHRVAEIEEESKVSEWRWVPTSQNVADDATRGVPANFKHDHRWFCGPDFLYHPEETWPQEPQSKDIPVTGEERVSTVTCSSSRILDSLPDASRFSSWLRLVRTTGRVLQFIDLCRVKHATTAIAVKRTRRLNEDTTWKPTISRRPVAKSDRIQSPTGNKIGFIILGPHYVEQAEKLWWRATQQENFEDDIVQLKRDLPVKRDSQLRTLSVVLDSEGTLRLRSRIDSAPHFPEEQRSPPILDGRSTYTRLYIAWIHCQNHHAGPETVINEVRSRLWVIRLRPVTRSILRSCIRCRILRAKPASPATGDHPSARLAHHQRPFTFVGLDYFGPYHVTIGRHHEKRYVALFTCLTTRAVHLELAGSLSTDSAIMALRRMMARRGCPSEIHSDNGTNLRGADAELRRAAYQVTKEESAVRSIRWRFIPPGAPFMGGVWERMVQSIKRALAATLNERHPSEEVLVTLLLEAEYTVNNRPLTPVSTSPEDLESLTPLHFILGGPARVPQPGSFEHSDLNARQRWRQTQRLADMFWSRWLKEYVSILQYRRDPRGRGQAPQVGDLVLIADENLPRNSWPKGRIEATYPGKDGVIRVVEVRTKAGNMKRPVKKIVVLTCGSAHDALGGECARQFES